MKKLGLLLMAACVGLSTLYATAEEPIIAKKAKLQNASGKDAYCIIKEVGESPSTLIYTAPQSSINMKTGNISYYSCYIGDTAEPIVGTRQPDGDTLCLFVTPTSIYWMPKEQCTSEQ